MQESVRLQSPPLEILDVVVLPILCLFGSAVANLRVCARARKIFGSSFATRARKYQDHLLSPNGVCDILDACDDGGGSNGSRPSPGRTLSFISSGE
eukprot:1206538-Pyramimonas_sp.AAC.1